MITVTVANQKGGVGKTSVCAGLGSALIDRGRYVALLDTDPQACLSLLGVPGVEQVEPRNLAQKLRRLAGMDYVLIDTPPALGPAVKVATDLADGILVPVLPEFLALRGLANLLAAIDATKVIGFAVTSYRGGYVRHHREALARIEKMGPVLAIIPFSISASDAGLEGKPITEHGAARSRGLAEAYHTLAEAIERWASKTDGTKHKNLVL